MITQDKYDQSSPCLYTTYKDLSERLDGSICRYKGRPFYVKIGASNEVFLNDLTFRKGGAEHTISAQDPDFDISTIEATYVNYEPSADQIRHGVKKDQRVYYISHKPTKKYKQGLYLSYSSVQTIDGKANNEVPNEYVGQSQGIIDAINDEFPPIPAVLMKFKEHPVGKELEYAVSADIALKKTPVGVIFVYYRTFTVGWMAPNSNQLTVVDDELKWVVDRYLSRLQW